MSDESVLLRAGLAKHHLISFLEKIMSFIDEDNYGEIISFIRRLI